MTIDDALRRVNSFDWDAWSVRTGRSFGAVYDQAITDSGERAAAAVDGEFDPADPFVASFSSQYVGDRITQLADTTKENVSALLRTVFESQTDRSPQEIAALVEQTVREHVQDYEGWRADRIARSESAIADNTGAALSYAQNGIEEVDVEDGTEDDICDEANGETWSVEEALNDPIGHPNCTRGFSPVLNDTQRRHGRWEKWTRDVDPRALAVAVALQAAIIEERGDPLNRHIPIMDEVEA